MKIIEYFKNFDEGDNITITADFINNVLNLEELLQVLIRQNNELNDNIEIMHKYIKILLKEIDE